MLCGQEAGAVEKQIKDMLPGERGYTVEWAYREGRLNMCFTVKSDSCGTSDMLVECISDGEYKIRLNNGIVKTVWMKRGKLSTAYHEQNAIIMFNDEKGIPCIIHIPVKYLEKVKIKASDTVSVQVEDPKPCYEEVWRFDLLDGVKTLNKFLKQGWRLQGIYMGEDEVWLKRRVCP